MISVDNKVLIDYTAVKVEGILKCSQEKLYFQHKLLPNIFIFVKYIYYQCQLSPTLLVVALIYLDRLKTRLPKRSIGEYDTPYKLFIAATILASKFMEDSNKSILHKIHKLLAPLYTMKQINEMERSFLGVIKFNLYVDIVEIQQFVQDRLTV